MKMSKEFRNDIQDASSRRIAHPSYKNSSNSSNVLNPILYSKKINCRLSNHSTHTSPQSSNTFPEQHPEHSNEEKCLQMSPKNVHSYLESYNQCQSSVNLNIKTGTKRKLDDETQQNPRTYVIPNSDTNDYNTGLVSSHSYVTSQSYYPEQFDFTPLGYDIHLPPVQAPPHFLLNDKVQFNSPYTKQQSSIPHLGPIQGLDEQLIAKNSANANYLLNQINLDLPGHHLNYNCRPFPTFTGQNHSDPATSKPSSYFDLCWPISRFISPVSKHESHFDHILLQQNMEDQQRIEHRTHHRRRRLRITEPTRLPNPDTSERVKKTGCPPWMYVRIPEIGDVVRLEFKDFRDLVTSIDRAYYFKTFKQYEEIPFIFERLMSQAQSTEDIAAFSLARSVCEAEDLVPTHPLSLDSILDMTIRHTKSEWFDFGSEILDEKMTRYMQYITRIQKVVQTKYGQLTGEQLACLMQSNYAHIFTFDFLTRDYILAFTAFTYLAVNFPMQEDKLWSQLTENEATVVDLIVRLATQMMALKLDFASYALLKAIRVFRDYDRPDMPDKHIVKSAYVKLQKCVYRTMKARHHDVAVANRGYSYMESFQTYFRGLMDLMDDVDKLAKMITEISPTRWPAILKIFIRISYVYNINQPDTVPRSFQKQLTIKRPFDDRD